MINTIKSIIFLSMTFWYCNCMVQVGKDLAPVQSLLPDPESVYAVKGKCLQKRGLQTEEQLVPQSWGCHHPSCAHAQTHIGTHYLTLHCCTLLAADLLSAASIYQFLHSCYSYAVILHFGLLLWWLYTLLMLLHGLYCTFIVVCLTCCGVLNLNLLCIVQWQ